MPFITESPFKAISILYRKSHIWLNNNCAKYGLTAAQAVVILIVCDFEMLTQDEITKRLGLDKSVVAKTVTKLVERGYLIRTTNPKDKRTYDITATEKASEIYEFLKEQLDDCFSKMTRDMTQEEKNQFKSLLMKATETTLNVNE